MLESTRRLAIWNDGACTWEEERGCGELALPAMKWQKWMDARVY